MMKCSRFFGLSLMTAVLISFWMVSSAAAECSYLRPLKELTSQMNRVVTEQTPADAATAQSVARQIENLQLGEVKRRLKGLGMSTQFQDARQLVVYAEEFSRTSHVNNPRALSRSIHNLKKLFDLLCRTESEDGQLNAVAGFNRIDYLTTLMESDDNVLKTILFTLILGAAIGLTLALRFLIGYAVGLFHHKKICRVSAEIHGNTQVFPGIVTRAGLNGVRFEFEDDAVAKRLTDLMASPEFVYFDLWIDNDHWPVFVDGYHKFFAPLYFLKRLKRKQLCAILRRSTRAIQNAPEIGHKSTRGKWREQINQRKIHIRKAAQRRKTAG